MNDTSLRTKLHWKYTKEAQHYDLKRYTSHKGRFYLTVSSQVLSSIVGLGRCSRLLDVATGTGRALETLVQFDAFAVGVDLTEDMLTIARRKFENSVNLMRSDAQRLPFQSDAFDAVSCFRFFHLIPQAGYGPFIEEMYRVLAPGGRLIMEFNSPLAGVLWYFVRSAARVIIRGKQPSSVLWPHQLWQHFEGYTIESIRGIYLPGTALLARLSPRLASWLNRTCNGGLFAYCCQQYVVVVRKADFI